MAHHENKNSFYEAISPGFCTPEVNIPVIEDGRVNSLKQRTCPFCSNIGNIIFTAKDENFHVTAESFSYSKCMDCETVYLNKLPTDLFRYYQNDYYEIPTLEQLKVVASKDRNKIEVVLEHARNGRLLEVGPAFGVFAWQAKQEGFEVDVIEMDERCCDYLRNTIRVNVIQNDVPHNAIKQLPAHDVIAIWHVLEHLDDPLAFLQAASANLKTGGILVIAMPNPDAFQFRVMNKFWPHLDAPRHLTLIPAELLIRTALSLGLKNVYLTCDDSDAKSWNRFGWQRLLMNCFGSKFMQRTMFVLGFVLSYIMSPFDLKNFNGSAYTIVFRKEFT